MHERKLIRLSEVTKQPLQYLWEDRVPLGAVTLIDGDPGGAKSTLTYDIAARLTTGRSMPGSEKGLAPAGVVLLQAEDDPAATIRPNLEAAGADIEQVIAFDKRCFSEERFVFPDGLPLVEMAIGEIGAKLVVIDPLAAFLPDGLSNAERVRASVGPLIEMAERLRVAVIGVRHLTKGGNSNALYRGAGSMSLIGLARSALLVTRDPDCEDAFQHVLALSKSNLGSASTLKFRTVKDDKGRITIEWLGESHHSASDLVTALNVPSERSALQDAKYVLYSLLVEGPLRAQDVMRRAREAAIAVRTLKRAKAELGVKSFKDGSGPGSRWYWKLPEDDTTYRMFKDKDLSDLMDSLIYGSDNISNTKVDSDDKPDNDRDFTEDADSDFGDDWSS